MLAGLDSACGVTAGQAPPALPSRPHERGGCERTFSSMVEKNRSRNQQKMIMATNIGPTQPTSTWPEKTCPPPRFTPPPIPRRDDLQRNSASAGCPRGQRRACLHHQLQGTTRARCTPFPQNTTQRPSQSVVGGRQRTGHSNRPYKHTQISPPPPKPQLLPSFTPRIFRIHTQNQLTCQKHSPHGCFQGQS